jgi:hypothetical protein
MDELQAMCLKAYRNTLKEGLLSLVYRNGEQRSEFVRLSLLLAGLHFDINCIKLHRSCLKNDYNKGIF